MPFPGWSPSSPKSPVRSTLRGDSIRLILDFLRQSTEPMTTRQIALQVMAVRALNADDGALVLTITRRVGASLRNSGTRGRSAQLKMVGTGSTTFGRLPVKARVRADA
jgi:hypothetical protein